jgi:PadR family transcriptional regulator PadR
LMTEQRSEDGAAEERPTPSAFPHDFLTPWLLLLLRNWSMHGYQLMQTMAVLGLAASDPATIYRTLRRLEKEGLINSDWEPGEAGPAKRVYSLTEAGEEFLQTWASALKQYQGILDRFFDLYASETRK